MYTYAFFTNPAPVSGLPTGIAGQLDIVTSGQISALVEPGLVFEEYEQNDERLMQAVLSHDRVLRELFRQTALLPLRFGTRFLSRGALIMHLQEHGATYLEKLEHLGGRAEYPLKLLPTEPPSPAVPSAKKGKDYFLEKKRLYQQQLHQHQQQEAELEQLRATISRTYPDVVHGASSQDAIERTYLLLPRQAEIDLLTQVQAWQRDFPHWIIELGEALPPYHFV
jgi:hypothetical protein